MPGCRLELDTAIDCGGYGELFDFDAITVDIHRRDAHHA
jgi:hypothetical protein